MRLCTTSCERFNRRRDAMQSLARYITPEGSPLKRLLHQQQPATSSSRPPAGKDRSERHLQTEVQAVVALGVIAETAAVAGPAAPGLVEVGGEADVGRGPGLVRGEALHLEAAAHAHEASRNVARVGATIVVVGHFGERMQHGVARVPRALDAPAAGFDTRVAGLLAEVHRGAVTAPLVVTVNVQLLEGEADERAGFQRVAAEPPAALQAAADMRAVGLARFRATSRAQVDATIDVGEAELAEAE